MDTKLKADIAESAAVTKLLKQGFKVLSYNVKDFDFALVYIEGSDTFYVMPVKVFIKYKSEITFVKNKTRQREPKSSAYKERWDLISKWAD